MPAAFEVFLKRIGWSGSATVRTVQKVRRCVKKPPGSARLSGGGAGFPLSPRRLSAFIEFAAEGMQLVFRQRAEGEEDGCSERLAPAFDRLEFEAESRPRLKQLASFLARLDRKACGRLVRMLEEIGRTNRAGRVRLKLEHLSFRLAAKEADIGVTEDGVPLRRRQLGLEQLQLCFQQAGGEGLPLPAENGVGAGLRSLPQGFLFDLQGTGDAVQATFDCGADWFQQDCQSEPGSGEEVSLVLTGESAPANPRLMGEWDHNSHVLTSEVSTVDELGVTEILSRFQPQENEERGGLYRVSNSAFRRADGCEGMVFDYFFGYRPF